MPIRQLFSEDAPAFQSLRLRGLLECPEAFTSSHAEEVDLPLDVIAQRLSPKPDGAVFGNFSGHNLVGLVGIYREARPKLLHKASIWGMYVAPEHRLKGIGRSLVAQAVEHASQNLGVRVVNLGVNTRNNAAVALYKSMGFQIYGTEPEFLVLDGVAHDQHLMRRHVHGVA
jgi:ribosomal protein S18 acetylase RimI-like enzyme